MTDTNPAIAELTAFRELLTKWSESKYVDEGQRIRSEISSAKARVRQIVIQAGCFRTMTISPPPAIGGLIYRNQDLFDLIFQAPYGMSVVQNVIDMIDESIGALQNPVPPQTSPVSEPSTEMRVQKDYAFIAMPMDEDDPDLEDVLDAIKEGASRCGIQAERIDEPESNDRITDRILESIRKAEFVIVDLTKTKPNVYFEAGFAHGIGKIPIYVARHGTRLEFDLKDYPVKFFKNMKELKNKLESRLRGISEERDQ